MKKFFRPVMMFPDQYVDLTILMVIVFLVALNLFVLSYSPTLWIARGAAVGVLLGAMLVGWEWFWHKRNNHQQFRPSYVYHNLTPVLLLIAMLGSDAVKASVLVAFLFLRLPVIAALLAVQFRVKRRFRWGELFPKEIIKNSRNQAPVERLPPDYANPESFAIITKLPVDIPLKRPIINPNEYPICPVEEGQQEDPRPPPGGSVSLLFRKDPRTSAHPTRKLVGCFLSPWRL